MTIEKRVERLEATNRHLRWMLTALGAAAVTGLILGAGESGRRSADEVADVIRARAFEVIGSDGQRLVNIGPSRNGNAGHIDVFNDRGRDVVGLNVDSVTGNGQIRTCNRAGHTLIMLSSGTQLEMGVVTTYDGSGDPGNKVVSISGDYGGDGRVSAFSKDGSPKAQWP
jgi:hypothetical protein